MIFGHAFHPAHLTKLFFQHLNFYHTVAFFIQKIISTFNLMGSLCIVDERILGCLVECIQDIVITGSPAVKLYEGDIKTSVSRDPMLRLSSPLDTQ